MDGCNMDTPSLTSMKQDAGSFVHVRINCPCRGVHRLQGQTLNYRTLVYCSSNNLTLNRHTKTLTNKHKMPFNSTCQLGCRVIILIYLTFFAVQTKNDTEQLRRDISSKLKIHINSGQKPGFECQIYNHLANQEEHKDHVIEEVCSF